jgi:hypothetical protein
MFIVYYKRNGHQFEEYLDLDYSPRDKYRYAYLLCLEYFYHIFDLQKERCPFYD